MHSRKIFGAPGAWGAPNSSNNFNLGSAFDVIHDGAVAQQGSSLFFLLATIARNIIVR